MCFINQQQQQQLYEQKIIQEIDTYNYVTNRDLDFISVYTILWVRELLMDCQDISFLPSRASLTHFVKNVEINGSTQPNIFKVWLTVFLFDLYSRVT